MRSEKKYVVTERELMELLACQMECSMNERDGVDNWSWYGASREEVIKDYWPNDELPEEYLSFYDVAAAMLEAGAYPEQIDIEEFVGNLTVDRDTVRDYMFMD